MNGDTTAGDRRHRYLLSALALLVVLALALGAAALDEIRLHSAGGSASSTADKPIDVGDTKQPPHPNQLDQIRLNPYYVLGFFWLMALSAVAMAWNRDVQVATLAVAVMVVVLIFVTQVFGVGSFIPATNSSANASALPDEPQLGSGYGMEQNTSPPATALPTGSLLFIGFLLGLVAILGFSRETGSVTEAAGDEKANVVTVADLGAAAGRAADRLADDGDLENPVYEAWRDMRTTLETSSDPTLTPAAFRDQAIAAGLPPGPVGELTAIFQEVRYGHEPTTEARVEATQAALREVKAAADDLTGDEDATESADEDAVASGPARAAGERSATDTDEYQAGESPAVTR